MSPAPPGNFDLQEYIMAHIGNSDQWHIHFLGTIPLPSFLTVHGLMIIFCPALLVILFCFIYQKNICVPHGITNLLEAFVVYIRDEISIQALGIKDGKKFTPFFCTLFFFILSLNLLGLIPLFSSATANINVTGALAGIILAIMIFGSIHKNGIKGFFRQFIPPGLPWPLLMIFVPIEFLSLFIRAFALMIRLFANILAGHIAIIALVGLVGVLGLVALPSVMLAVFVLLLETFIAFLQAYIFTLLSAIFIGQAFHPEH